METIRISKDPNYQLPTGGRIHSVVQKFWKKQFNKNKKKKHLAKRLQQLRGKRNLSDYNLKHSINSSDAKKYLAVAKVLIQEIEVIK